eukprot:1155839-Pelagomonas_calceolata.AAC.24
MLEVHIQNETSFNNDTHTQRRAELKDAEEKAVKDAQQGGEEGGASSSSSSGSESDSGSDSDSDHDTRKLPTSVCASLWRRKIGSQRFSPFQCSLCSNAKLKFHAPAVLLVSYSLSDCPGQLMQHICVQNTSYWLCGRLTDEAQRKHKHSKSSHKKKGKRNKKDKKAKKHKHSKHKKHKRAKTAAEEAKPADNYGRFGIIREKTRILWEPAAAWWQYVILCSDEALATQRSTPDPVRLLVQVDASNKRSEFILWALEVKKKDPELMMKNDERELFRDFMEDYNTGGYALTRLLLMLYMPLLRELRGQQPRGFCYASPYRACKSHWLALPPAMRSRKR